MKKFIMILLASLAILNINAQSKAFTIEITGKGQPILLIPGFSCSGDVWKETVALLQNRYEFHVLTIAGFAGVAPINAPTLKTVRDEIIRYVQSKKMVKPIIIGHSMGSFMGLWVSSIFESIIFKS